ncbi:adenylyl-sulfate kinase [Thermodesulfovibrio sp.]|uniref:adenylyl-sulfate kinase n=1 Tax=Thermodesulfovibrio sp. TaxID=2067987 RepID=UPI0030B1F567
MYSQITKNIVWHNGFITRKDRNNVYGHKSGVLWFTGLPSSGKSSIAHTFEKLLFEKGIKCYVLDGDNIRHGLNADLDFGEEDRRENIRRVVEVAKLFVDAGLIVLASFVSPYKKDREYIRRQFEGDNFIEIYVKCSVEECARRDPKGYYEKAKKGLIKGYTGVDSPYEEPERPDIVIDTEKTNIDDAVVVIFKYLKYHNWF